MNVLLSIAGSARMARRNMVLTARSGVRQVPVPCAAHKGSVNHFARKWKSRRGLASPASTSEGDEMPYYLILLLLIVVILTRKVKITIETRSGARGRSVRGPVLPDGSRIDQHVLRPRRNFAPLHPQHLARDHFVGRRRNTNSGAL